MAKNYTSPGVYIEEVSKLPPSVAQVQTAVPVFIGYTAKATDGNAPLLTDTIDGITICRAQRISSLLQYEQCFGKSLPQVNVAITEAGAILNSKLKKYTVTAAKPTAATLYNHLQLFYSNGGGDCYVVSVGNEATGIDAANLLAGLKMAAKYDEPTLLIIPQLNLLLNATEAGKVYVAAMQQAAELADRFAIFDCYNDDPEALRNNTGINNLKYGAAYHPFLQVGCRVDDTVSINIKLNKTIKGTGPNESKPLFKELAPDIQALVNTELAKQYITIPPSAAVAGVYAAVDNSRGVWKAPANVSLNGVAGLTKQVDDGEQDGLNVDVSNGKSINVIRSFVGKGILIWGSRTLMGNDNEWRYVPVRRFFIMVEESIKKSTELFVFEPNDANTWVKVKAMVENYLTTLWRAGALQGAKPEHAFYVAVGLNKTMTSLDILEGRLIVEIGMAAVRPAEFIVLRFAHKMSQG